MYLTILTAVHSARKAPDSGFFVATRVKSLCQIPNGRRSQCWPRVVFFNTYRAACCGANAPDPKPGRYIEE